MKSVLHKLALCVAACFATHQAHAQKVFDVPQAFPRERYEAGWNKNPFTLKTAPVIEQKQSFAKDLFLLNAYQVLDEVTVVIANPKTQELIRLKNTEAAANGMRIRSAMIHDSRKDSYVEVELHGESAILRHDDDARKQMLARSTKSRPKAETTEEHKEPPVPSKVPPTPLPLQQPLAGASAQPSSTVRGPARPASSVVHSNTPGNVRPTGLRPSTLPPRGAPTASSRRVSSSPVAGSHPTLKAAP